MTGWHGGYTRNINKEITKDKLESEEAKMGTESDGWIGPEDRHRLNYFPADGFGTGSGGGSGGGSSSGGSGKKEKRPKPLNSQGNVEINPLPIYFKIGFEGKNLLFHGISGFPDFIIKKLSENTLIHEYAGYENLDGVCKIGSYDGKLGMEIYISSSLIDQVRTLSKKLNDPGKFQKTLFSGKYVKVSEEISALLKKTKKKSFHEFGVLEDKFCENANELRLGYVDGDVFYFNSAYNVVMNFREEPLKEIPFDAYVFNVHSTMPKYCLEKLAELGYAIKEKKSFRPAIESEYFKLAFGELMKLYNVNGKGKNNKK